MADKRSNSDITEKELNTFVQQLLKQMQDSFEQMSESVITKIDDMGKNDFVYQCSSVHVLREEDR